MSTVNSKMTALANAIRDKSDRTDLLTIDEMTIAVQDIEVGTAEPTLQDKTVTPTTSEQTIVADSGYDGLDTVTIEAIPTVTQATPSINIDENGKITANATQIAGYVIEGTKSSTKQLTTQDAKTITPTKSSQTAVAKDVYTTGVITVDAIPNEYIIPTGVLNITENGTHDVKNFASATVDISNGVDLPQLSNEATASELFFGKELIDQIGNKVIGTFTIEDEIATQDNLISQITTALEGKAANSGIDTSDATATASDILNGKTAYANGKKITGTITSQAAKTVTPSTSSQTAVAQNVYTTGVVTVAGDSNLVAENIKNGISIFGVAGTYEGSGSGGGSSIETCTLTIAFDGPPSPGGEIYYISSDLTLQVYMVYAGSITVMKNSIITLYQVSVMTTTTTLDEITSGMGNYSYYITGDATITLG